MKIHTIPALPEKEGGGEGKRQHEHLQAKRETHHHPGSEWELYDTSEEPIKISIRRIHIIEFELGC